MGAGLGRDSNGNVMQNCTPARMQPILTVSTTAASSTPVSLSTTMVELWCSVDGYYSVGTTPAATTTPGDNNIKLHAETARTITVRPGSVISFITISGSGTAEVIEMM
jgi:hypothetical protein